MTSEYNIGGVWCVMGPVVDGITPSLFASQLLLVSSLQKGIEL